MSYIYNSWVGYSKPLMDLRDDGPMPSPPDNPADSECFWSTVAQNTQVLSTNGFDLAVVVTPQEFDATVVVEPAGFDAIN